MAQIIVVERSSFCRSFVALDCPSFYDFTIQKPLLFSTSIFLYSFSYKNFKGFPAIYWVYRELLFSTRDFNSKNFLVRIIGLPVNHSLNKKTRFERFFKPEPILRQYIG